MAQSNVENFSPQVIKQIYKELCDLTQNPLEGIRVVYNDNEITSVQADIDGPLDTPYYGGSFRIRLVLGKNFPVSPPKGFFVTKIFHPNVGRNGEICVNTLKKDWNSDLGIKHILLTIKCLLIVPNPESALNEEAGKMLLEQYEDYCKRAKMMTEIHAPKSKSINCTSECDQQQQSSSSSTTTVGMNNTTNISGGNTITLLDKTSSSSTTSNLATSNASNVGQKQPLDGICCSEEPVTKRLNSLLDCYNNPSSTADNSVSQQSASQGSSTKTVSPQKSIQSKLSASATSAISNKNRGLKRVLRMRS